MPMPLDYQLEQEKLKRRRELAQAMLEDSQKPWGDTQVVSGIALRRSPFEGLGKLAKAYMASEQGKAIDAEQKSLGERRRADIGSAIEEYTRGVTPSDAVPAIPSPSDELGGGPGAPSQPANVPTAASNRAAAMRLMGAVGDPADSAKAMVAAAMSGPKYHSLSEGQALVPEPTDLSAPVKPVYVNPKVQPPTEIERELEAAGIKRGTTQWDTAMANRVTKQTTGFESTAPTELRKLMDERDALPAGDPRVKVYNEKIAKLNAPSSTMINMSLENTEEAKATRQFMAKQYLAGDKSVVVGLGRSPRELLAMRKAIHEEANAQGMTPVNVAVKLAEFEGLKAGERTAGTREAQLGFAAHELDNFIPLALKASEAVPRTAFKPINQLIQLGESQWSPEQAALVAANRAVINSFAMVASRGVQTVHNVQEAEKMLSTAGSHPVYKATLDQLTKEVKGALEAPKQVRSDLADRQNPAPPQRRATDVLSAEDRALIDKYK